MEPIIGVAALLAALLIARSARPTPTPEPQGEVWIRRTTTVEEFRATGPAVHTSAHVFDPQYATRLPMLEGSR